MSLYSSVKSGKVSELIAQQIKESILNGTIKPGDSLPPVRKLVEHFEASSASVREALKTLEASGLLAVKPGSGVFVTELDSQPMGEYLFSVLRMRKISLDEVTQARIILEPAIARLAAEKRTPEDLRELELNVRESSQMAKTSIPAHAKFIEFHSIIAVATHNLILTLTIQTVLDALRTMALEVRDKLPSQSQNAFEIVRTHEEMVKAIKKKNSKEAYELMMRDIVYFQQRFRGFESQVKQKG